MDPVKPKASDLVARRALAQRARVLADHVDAALIVATAGDRDAIAAAIAGAEARLLRLRAAGRGAARGAAVEGDAECAREWIDRTFKYLFVQKDSLAWRTLVHAIEAQAEEQRVAGGSLRGRAYAAVQALEVLFADVAAAVEVGAVEKVIDAWAQRGRPDWIAIEKLAPHLCPKAASMRRAWSVQRARAKNRQR